MEHNLLATISRALAPISIDFGGGCSVYKAYVMAWLIRRFDLTATVDIGVYRGRSLLPQAVAHHEFTGGTAYGVDPWSAKEAEESDHPALREKIKEFVNATDYDGLFRDLKRRIESLDLAEHARLVRSPSVVAAKVFHDEGKTFGLIHIDGNHDTTFVLQDVHSYLPLLQSGGFLILDDVSWEAIHPAERHVASCARLVLRCVSPDGQDDFAVFWKDSAAYSAKVLGERLSCLV